MKPFLIFTVVSTVFRLTGFTRNSRANAYVPARDLNELQRLAPMSALPFPDGLELKCVLLGIGMHINTSTGDDNDPSDTTPVYVLDQLHQIPYPIALIRKLDETKAPTSSHPGTQAEANIKWPILKDLRGISRGGITVYYIEPVDGNDSATFKCLEPNFGADYVTQCEFSALLHQPSPAC